VAGLLGAAAILKVLIDVIVHYKECLLEKENERVLPGQSVRIYYDLDEFSKAVQKRGGIR
jgi:hypothetical protein